MNWSQKTMNLLEKFRAYSCNEEPKLPYPNKLRGLRFYEAGPLDRCTQAQAENWRKDMTKWLQQRGAVAFNPVEKPCSFGLEGIEERELINKLKREEKYDEIYEYGKQIRHVDLRLVDLSDVIICYLSTKIHMAGSYQELFLGLFQHKPVLLVVEEGKKETPSWILFAVKHHEIFSSFDELKQYLDYIDNGGEPYTKNRWLFFDKDKLQ